MREAVFRHVSQSHSKKFRTWIRLIFDMSEILDAAWVIDLFDRSCLDAPGLSCQSPRARRP